MDHQSDGFGEIDKQVLNFSSKTGFRPSNQRSDLEKKYPVAKELKITSELGWKV